MTKNRDRLSEAFSLLASDADAVAPPDPVLENRMMTESVSRVRRSSRHTRWLTAAGVLVGICGATVVAAGGVNVIVDWFATAEIIRPDGTREVLEVTPEGRVYLDKTHFIQASPEGVSELKGNKLMFLVGPKESEPSESESEK